MLMEYPPNMAVLAAGYANLLTIQFYWKRTLHPVIKWQIFLYISFFQLGHVSPQQNQQHNLIIYSSASNNDFRWHFQKHLSELKAQVPFSLNQWGLCTQVILALLKIPCVNCNTRTSSVRCSESKPYQRLKGTARSFQALPAILRRLCIHSAQQPTILFCFAS